MKSTYKNAAGANSRYGVATRADASATTQTSARRNVRRALFEYYRRH